MWCHWSSTASSPGGLMILQARQGRHFLLLPGPSVSSSFLDPTHLLSFIVSLNYYWKSYICFFQNPLLFIWGEILAILVYRFARIRQIYFYSVILKQVFFYTWVDAINPNHRIICNEAYFCTWAWNCLYIKHTHTVIYTCKTESDGEMRYNLAYL